MPSNARGSSPSDPPPPAPAPASRFQLFCATALGFEGLLGQELQALGLKSVPVHGGVELTGGFEEIEKVHLWSRVAESMRLRLKPFSARDFEALVAGLTRLPWQAYLGNAKSLHVSVTCHQSRLYHSEAIRERCLQVVGTKLRRELSSVPRKEADQSVFVRVVADRVQVSVDASGELLHRRGERLHVSKAPLRETVAAGLVGVLGPVERVWDPFCGGGTLLLEWLRARDGSPAGARRGFAFEQWPAYRSRQAAWQERKLQAMAPASQLVGVGEEAMPEHAMTNASEPVSLASALDSISLASASEPVAWGSDIEARALAAARHNLAPVGSVGAVVLAQEDFERMESRIPANTAILSNPPYGVRLSAPGLRELYARFDQLLLRREDLRPAVIITGYLPYRTQSKLPWRVVVRTKVGGIPAEVLRLQ